MTLLDASPVTGGDTSGASQVVDVRGLTIDMMAGPMGSIRIVDDVSFAIAPGERIALVGESGSGKSVTARALMRLDHAARVSGSVMYDGRDLLTLTERQMHAVRGSAIGMVFQDPMSFLDPLMTIGDQVAEALRIRGVGRDEARRRVVEILDELRVARAAERLDSYPHEFSGGMRQRVVLAMALIGEPRLLIADEPTTALDVRVQDQVLDLLDDVARRRGLAVLLITHDLGVVAGFAERVMVMYSGRIVEDQPVDGLFGAPQHPYTEGLIRAVPRIDQDFAALYAIPGAPPPPMARPSGCPFHPRCDRNHEPCLHELPLLRETATGRVACHLHDPRLAGAQGGVS